MSKTTMKFDICYMREEESKTWIEIGQQFGISESTARWHYNSYIDDYRSGLMIYDDKVSTEKEGNVTEVTVPNTIPEGVFIRTVPELIEFAGVDLDEFEITKEVVNFWGSRDNPNTQVKAWLVPKEPVAVHPVISPVEINTAGYPQQVSRDTKMQVGMFLFDFHFGFRRSLRTGRLEPFHDRRAIDVALQIAQALSPDVIGLGGDLLDLADWQPRFVRSPNLYWTTQPALIEGAWWLEQFRSKCDEMIYVPGNHDQRMEDLQIDHMKEAYGLRAIDELELPPAMSIPKLMAFHQLGIEYEDRKYPSEVEVWPGLKLIHGETANNKPLKTADRILQERTKSALFGHVHRREMATKRTEAGEVFAASPGCLCRVDGMVPGSTERSNWQQGIVMVTYDDGLMSLEFIPITNGVALHNGYKYTSRDRLEELRHDTVGADGAEWPY